MNRHKALNKLVSLILAFLLVISLMSQSFALASNVYAAPEESLGILDIQVNKPVKAVVDLELATIDISLPYGTLYQMLNVTTNPGASATLYRSDETSAISFAASGINKGDAKMDQFSSNGTTLFYLKVTDKNNSSNSRKYTITVTVDSTIPPLTSTVGPNNKYSPLNIQAGESAWDVIGASKIGYGSGTGSIEGPGSASSYSGKSWTESVYDRSGDYPAASTVPESWLGDNMYLQTIGKNDEQALAEYGIANVPGTEKLNSDILRYHEFLPFTTPDGVSRDDGDRGAVNSDRQRLEIKTNTSASNSDANSVGGEIMTHHWRLMLPSETLKFQQDTAHYQAGDFINPHRFWHIFQLKDAAGNANGQPVTTLTLVSSDGKGQLEFRNNPDGDYADRIKPLFTIPLDKVVDRWIDIEVTILTADKGYVYGKVVDLASNEVLFDGGMTAETYRRPQVENPITGRKERVDLPAEAGQQNRSKWGLYRGMYNGAGDADYADEFQAATMYLADVYLIKRDDNSYIFPDGWNPNVQDKDVVAWARPQEITASKGTAFNGLALPAQLDVTMSTGKTEKVNVTWNSAGYNPDSMGTYTIEGAFNGAGFTNTQGIKPYITVSLSDYKNWAATPGAAIKVVSESGGSRGLLIDDNSSTVWQANSSLTKTPANQSGYQYWAAVQLEKQIDVSKIQIEWSSNSSYLKNYQVYATNNAAAYAELVGGGTVNETSSATRKPLQTANGASWIPIPGAGKATALSNNEKADITLAEPVAAQYLLLLSDVTLSDTAGSIKSNEFRIFGEPSGSKDPDIPTATGSVNLLDPSRFTPQAGVNLKVSSETSDHPGVDALRSEGSGYWRNSSSNTYMSNYSPSSLAITLDLGEPKTIDKLHLEIPNTIPNIQNNASRFEVYYSNDPNSWASAPTPSDSAGNYDWKAHGWSLAGGTETEGLWSYVTYDGQRWGYDNKTFLYPFTARYVMVNTVLVGPRDNRMDDNSSMMGLSGLAIYGKIPVTNVTALVPAKDTYSTWDQVASKSTSISLANGQTLTSITKGATTLRPNVDYTLSGGNTVTFTLPYLAKLPLGTNEITFNFNNGDPSIYALDVTARGYGANDKTIKMNAIEGVSPYNVLGGAMGTDESVEGVTKRIRDAYHEYYGDQPRATAADDHVQSVWDSILQKNVFKVFEYGRGVNNEFADKVRDGEYGHKGVFDWNLGYVVDGAAINDRQRVEIRPSEDSTQDFTAYEGDLVNYAWMWNIPDGNQWNQSNFRHIFQLKATNAQEANTLPGGNTSDENGAYILAMSISGTTSRNLVVNHNRFDGDKNLLTIPLKEIDGHWIKVELNALISDTGWLTIKITDTVTGKVYTYDSPDVYQVYTNSGATDGVKDLWRRPQKSTTFESEYPATFDQYERPKWGIYRSSNGGNNSAYDAELQLSDITISKVATGVSAVNLALNKNAYNIGPTTDANAIQLESAGANVYGNANKLTNGVLQDPTKWPVTNVTSLSQIGNYSWLGTDGARKGSFVIDLGQAMDFSQIRLFAQSTRLKGATVYISEDAGDHASAAEFDAMTFTQVDKRTEDGYTFATGNTNGGTDSADSSYPIDLGKTYHARYIKVTVENASGGNTGADLTGPPRLTQVQVFNAPTSPQNLKVETSGSTKMVSWDANPASEGFTVYNGTAVLADVLAATTSYTLPSNVTDLTQIAVRSKGTDPYSRKFMISAPSLLVDVQAQPDNSPKLLNLKVDGMDIPGFSPDETSYTYDLNSSMSTLPAVTAEAAQGFTVKEIVYPANYKLDPVTISVVSNSDVNIQKTYTVLFVLPGGEPLTFPLQNNPYTKNSSISLSGASGAGSQAEWPASVTGYAQLNGTTAVGDDVTFTLSDIPAGTYKVLFGYKTNNNRATMQLSVDGANQGNPVDEYATAQSYPIQDLGQIAFESAGDHAFKFTMMGATGSGRTATFSFIQLVPLDSEEQPIFVESLTLNKGTLTINQGASEQLVATVLPVNATNKAVAWTSSNPAVATVDENGLVTGVGAGQAAISATIGRFTNVSAVTVIASEVPVIVSIAPINIITKTGTAPELPSVVTAVYSDNSVQQLAVVWDTIDESQYASAGTFHVSGTVAGTSLKAKATVAVTESGTAEPPVWPSQSSLTVSAVGERTATLQWTAAEASRGIAGYTIYSVVGAVYKEYASAGNVLAYPLTGLTPDTLYTFAIQAVDADGFRSVYGPKVGFKTQSVDSSSPSNPAPIGTSPGSTTPPTPGSTSHNGNIDLEKDTKVTKETKADGETVTHVVVDADKLESALANPIVKIDVKGDDSTVNVGLPGNAIRNVGNQSHTVIQIQANGVNYELPVSLFTNIPKDSTVSITISKVSGKTGDDVGAAVDGLNAKQIISNPIAFTVSVNGAEMTDFGGAYVDRTIRLGTMTVDPSKITAVWVDANNKVHFVPSLITTNNGISEITIRSPHNSTYTVIQSNQSFTDLQGHWAKADVELLANKWIVDGKTDARFAPDSQVTRAEFTAMLVRSLGLVETKASGFSDVQSSDWFAEAVDTAKKAGLVDGYEDGSFMPNTNITREQMVAMLMRAMKVGGKEVKGDNTLLNGFADRSEIGDWSRSAVSQALAAGLIQGVSDNTFAANELATRAQAATILKRMLQSLQFIN
ncbi:S-layer homology domain-containing protein [Paenibacillus oryzisoli]|uniref:S-layer homology domain-containing protein n=1 Tax=Paenibacillus oryzisoli TaxID=1850517 RepID=UPI003D2CD4CF